MSYSPRSSVTHGLAGRSPWRVAASAAILGALLVGAGCGGDGESDGMGAGGGGETAAGGTTGVAGAGNGGTTGMGGTGTSHGGTTGVAGTGYAGTVGTGGTASAGTTGSSQGGTTGLAGAAGGGGGRAGTSGGAGTTGVGGGAPGGGSGGGSSGTYNPCPATGDCKILPVGDSITFGINQEGSYRIELFHKALMAMQKITYTGTLQNGPQMVDNVAFPRRYEATSGITIDGISSQITKNKTLDMPADIITVHIGTNDMYMSNPDGAPMRLGSLLDKLSTALPNALIVVAKIIPLPSGAAAVKKFNDAIPGIIQTRVAAGKHIIIIDLNSSFPTSGLSSDNVHPNVSGYAWMGDRWYDLLGPLFRKQ